MRISRVVGAWVLALSVSGVFAADNGWTQFRGSDGTGIAAGARPPMEWSATKNLRWKTALPGPGASSPVRSGDRIFVTCYSGFGENGRAEGEITSLVRHLICVDATNGRIRWSANVPGAPSEIHYTRLAEHGYASHTPATDGERVFVFFGKSGVLAFDLEGKRLWLADVGQQAGRQGFGSAASLVLHKDLVIVNAAEESQSIRALEKATGRERWRADGRGFANVYNTPLQLTLPDGRHELVVAVQDRVRGLDADTGRERWSAAAPIAGNLAASVIAADGILYAFGGNRSPGTVAIRTGGTGDVTTTHVLWTATRGPDFGTPVFHEGHLYFATSRGMAVCLDAKTGAEVYQERLGGGRGGARTYASPILADGKLFLATRNSGTLVIAAKPVFEQLAQNVIADDRTDFSATPMISGREIFLRSNRALYCFAAEAGGAGRN